MFVFKLFKISVTVFDATTIVDDEGKDKKEEVFKQQIGEIEKAKL